MDTSRIFELAKKQGKSIAHLCRLLGKSRSYLNDVRRGAVAMPESSLKIIADDLGTTPGYLNWETDDPNKTDMDTIERIMDLLNKRGLKDSEVVTACALSNGVIGQWRAHKQKPSAEAIVKLSSYFGVSSDYLLCLTNDLSGDTNGSRSSADTVIKDQLTDDADVVIYRRDGKTTVRKLTPEQLRMFERLLDAVDDSNSDL